MYLSRRNVLSAGLGLSVAATLAACGAQQPTSPGASSAAPGQALPSGPVSGSVTMWSGFTQGPRADYMKAMGAKFEAANPGTKITIETFAWPEITTKWTNGINAGQVPDVATALPTQVVEMLNAEALVPIDDVVNKIGRNRFSNSALTEGSKEGKSYSVPIYSHAQVLWYRKDLLDSKGLKVPTTWDELAAAAKAIGRSNDVFGLSVPFGTADMMGVRYLNFYVRSAGARLLKDDGSANLTSQASRDGIRYWVDLYKAVSPEGSINYKVLDQATLFYQGKTAFDFNSGFHISGVQGARPDLVDKIAAANLPRLKASDPAVYPAEVSNIAMVVFKPSKVQPAAKAFLASLYADPDYIKFLHSVPGGMLPALSGIDSNPAYQDNPIIKQFASSIKVIQDEVAVGSAIGMEKGPTVQGGILTSQGVVERMFHEVILKGTDPAVAAKAAEDELNKLFKTAGVTFGK